MQIVYSYRKLVTELDSKQGKKCKTNKLKKIYMIIAAIYCSRHYIHINFNPHNNTMSKCNFPCFVEKETETQLLSNLPKEYY